MTMKRVLHIMNRLEYSGMETMLLSSSNEWERHGYKCDIVAVAATAGPVAGKMGESGYGVFHLPFRGKSRYLPNLKFLRDYYRLCRAGYDVVHVQTEAATALFVLIAKFAGVRQIAVTPHNTFRFGGLLRARKIFERWLIRSLGGRYGMISNAVKECEWERFRNKGVRIWNWFDHRTFRPPTEDQRAEARKQLGIGEGPFVVVSLGNCNSAKNHAVVLHAIQRLRGKIALLYLHVGREDTQYSERELASELGVAEEVRFVGSQRDPLQFLWAADVFVMPSLNEGVGIAAIEAIAARTPAILSDVAGLHEVAAETKWTVLIPPTAEALASAILSVAEKHSEERISHASEDSRLVAQRFSINNGVRSVVEGLYKEPRLVKRDGIARGEGA